ncbi:hypothetical protein CDL15_Pgr013052 [Punica granatum]|uniref:Uncharacterized protein n=1 Tax=Punica granatum TaxID=22663 RepID=A0A218WIC2_PUNGR|nr:hypothetical protein CDL15_Pgr013052 [Punica granatum]PKI76572.1 hypothetical protein CRG98_003031 [Punica granatum]
MNTIAEEEGRGGVKSQGEALKVVGGKSRVEDVTTVPDHRSLEGSWKGGGHYKMKVHGERKRMRRRGEWKLENKREQMQR